jgi:O-antigen/teichoic acid export membrane protein
MPVPETNASAASGAVAPQDAARIARGMIAMIASQLLTTPLSVVVSAVLARRLGPQEFGSLYLAQAAVGLGFLIVDWGQTGAMAGMVARDRSLSLGLLGTSMVLKVLFGLVAIGVLVGLGALQGYSPVERTAVIILSIGALAGALQASGTAVLRGYEQLTQVSALAFAGNLASAFLVMALALAGLGLNGVLWGSMLSAFLPIIPTVALLARLGLRMPRFDRSHVRTLLGQGSAFLFFGLVLALQPYIDSGFLARLAPSEVLGWHAVTRRIAGVLLFPAVSLGFTMYPSLARLHREAPEREIELMRGALRLMVLAGVPAAIGSALFAGPIVHVVYGSGRYEGAILNLQLLAPWVLLVYFSILIGNCLLAANRVVTWTLVQALCLVVSAVGDAPLIRYFQGRMANGALGVTAAGILSEILMVAFGVGLIPRAMLRGGLLRASAQAVAAGLAMAGVALALGRVPSAVAMVASAVAYLAALWVLGALRGKELHGIFVMVRSRARDR